MFSPTKFDWLGRLTGWRRLETHVAETRIFARVEGNTQWLAYQTRVGTSSDVAMILPVPVVPSNGEDALSFIDLSGYGTFSAQTGDQILRLLGGNAPDQRKWADRQARAWTLLNTDDAEVYAVGRTLKRADGDVETAFPSLVAASRAVASRSTTSGQPATPPAQGGDGGGPPAGGAIK